MENFAHTHTNPQRFWEITNGSIICLNKNSDNFIYAIVSSINNEVKRRKGKRSNTTFI